MPYSNLWQEEKPRVHPIGRVLCVTVMIFGEPVPRRTAVAIMQAVESGRLSLEDHGRLSSGTLASLTVEQARSKRRRHDRCRRCL